MEIVFVRQIAIIAVEGAVTRREKAVALCEVGARISPQQWHNDDSLPDVLFDHEFQCHAKAMDGMPMFAGWVEDVVTSQVSQVIIGTRQEASPLALLSIAVAPGFSEMSDVDWRLAGYATELAIKDPMTRPLAECVASAAADYITTQIALQPNIQIYEHEGGAWGLAPTAK